MNHIRKIVDRYVAWVDNKNAFFVVGVDAFLFPGILLLTIWLVPNKPSTLQLIAYCAVNAPSTVLQWMISTARHRLYATQREALYNRRVELEQQIASAENRALRDMLKARQRAELLPPDRRAKMLAKLDAIAARMEQRS
jgi:hypothetical protein